MTDRQDTSPGPGPVEPGGATAYDGGTPPATSSATAAETSTATSSATSSAAPPDSSPRPVAVRRPDVPGGLLLLLAGAAAAVSLLLRWLRGDDATGMDLVRRGFAELGDGVGTVVGTGFWQPLTVVVGGAVLLVLGLVLFLPARRHRLFGLLALLVAAAVGAAVLVPLVQAGGDAGTFRAGFWCAVAVAVLGLLGALKALLTGTRTTRR